MFKASRYETLITDLHSAYYDIKCVNISINAVEIFASPSNSLLSMLNDFNLDKSSQN